MKTEWENEQAASCEDQEHYIQLLNQQMDALLEENKRLRGDNKELSRISRHGKKHEEDLEAALSALSASPYWRASWPLRYGAGKAKALLRAVPGLRSGYGMLASWRRGGKEGLRQYKQARLSQKARQAEKAKWFPGVALDVEFFTPWEELYAQRTVPQTGPLISILVPLYNTPEPFLREMLASVQNQSYQNWQLCLADASDAQHAHVGEIAKKLAGEESRVLYRHLAENKGIAGNTNAALEMASGEYIGLLDHDDLLFPNALYEVAGAITAKGAEMVYTDETHLLDGQFVNPFHKPDWSPDLLNAQNYICHFLVFRRQLLGQSAVFSGEYDGAQDYDLVLRLSENTSHIVHIPKLLYAWREHAQSTAANAEAKPYANEAGRLAVEHHLKRQYGPAAYAENGAQGFTYQPRFPLPSPPPLVSIIIPFKDKPEMTDTCVQSILEKTSYPHYEILLLDNRSENAATFRWIEEIQKAQPRVRVLKADFAFNWSRLNNFGAQQAAGEVLVFLNNDTRVITENWLELLAENALRPEVGVVGGLLLYPDGSIQHAGVVVGMNGWADHVFKGMEASHWFSPYVSPVLSRNVTAVTGALQAVSRSVFARLGGFDEEFIICGSDVAFCLEALNAGLAVLYNAQVRLYHDESKSRDSYIPESDFSLSKQAYERYWQSGDPYFNPNLHYHSTAPRLAGQEPDLDDGFEETIFNGDHFILDVRPLAVRRDEGLTGRYRINLLVPSICEEHVFGGVATAVKFFESIAERQNCDRRIVLINYDAEESDVARYEGYMLAEWGEECGHRRQIVSMADRHDGRSLPVGANDVFIATTWWSAYLSNDVLHWQQQQFGTRHRLIYLVQDYEPYFYAWSSQFSLAEATYKQDLPMAAVFNSRLLQEYFAQQPGHNFEESYCFDAPMNQKLFSLLEPEKAYERKKQIIFYGRPEVRRNCFELIILALLKWSEVQPDAADWKVYSVGAKHPPVVLPGGLRIESLGRLSLEAYAKLMQESYAGISLMVSPHPSYPPLEMSTFGVRTITNCYANKDLTGFNENIISLQNYAPGDIAAALGRLCDEYQPQRKPSLNPEYCTGKLAWEEIVDSLCSAWPPVEAETLSVES